MCGALRGGLGATFAFLSDDECRAIIGLDIVDKTDRAHPRIAIRYIFSVGPDLAIHKIYDVAGSSAAPRSKRYVQDMRAMMLNYHPD